MVIKNFQHNEKPGWAIELKMILSLTIRLISQILSGKPFLRDGNTNVNPDG